ncbi:site-specific integrase [Mycobacterium sp. PSTR-4-N]|uniref:tyrosine-type recombinase/integrase n=1 Tax=Mycobacterium sp. PSTR-4-N TaxID=2917745 RepID=UPI001F15677C|nr:site-specific integrase [Mycobacterium sp. PSTR-4-N]MCG7592451.1 site-specific integrase [Mycobacterium sp. PSTR-4-N]
MAYVRTRYRRDGSPYYSVYCREGGRTGKQECIASWNDRADAEHCKQLANQVGADKARQILNIVASPRQSQTLAQYLTKYIDHLTGIQAGTINRYRAYVRNDLAPIGDIPLTALTKEDVAKWVNAMAEKASAKTVKNKRDFVSGALKAAVKAGTIHTNPAEDVRNPTWLRREMVFLTPAEFQTLLAAVPAYWQPLVEFLVSTGARWSEATALQPGDIDLTAGTVRISKAWKTGAGGYTLGTTKTRKSVRTINVPARVLEQLDLTGEWVFTNSGRGKGNFSDGVTRADTGPVRIHSFQPNVWQPAIARAQERGLTKTPRLHDLRHTCASWLLQAGRPIPAVQQQLGHESIQTTVDVYGHLDRSSGVGNAAAMDAVLKG